MIHQIITVGDNLESTLLGLKIYGPDKVYLIVTDETEDVCDHIKRMIPKVMKVSEHKVEPYDGRSVMDLCENLRRNLGKDDKLVYNLSEGTNVMVLAAARVAFTHGDKAFYISQEQKIVDLASFESESLTQSIDTEEFIEMYGNKMSSYQDIDDLLTDDVVTSLEIKHFIETHHKEFTSLGKWYRQHINDDGERLPDCLEVSGLQASFKGGLQISKDDKIIYNSKNVNAVKLMFEGRWWEIIVSDIVRMWNDGCHPDADIWRSVVFQNEDNDEVKNEIDILANDESRLLIVECKSGRVYQDNIYKLHSVRETYGGNDSKAILVSYYPLDESIKEKCDDLHIFYFSPDSWYECKSHHHKLLEWLNAILKENEI